MNKFEAVILFSPDLSIDIISKHEKSFKESLSKLGGSVIASEDWGLRDLSYKIKNNQKSFYRFYQIEIKGKNIQEIKRILTQNEKIIRHLFVKVEDHAELPTKLSKDENKEDK